MEENIAGENQPTDGKAFYVEAAISEGGPKRLRVVPAGDHFLLYDSERQLGAIKQTDGRWKLVDGDLTDGAVQTVGLAIARLKN